MNLQEVEAFLAIADTRSITKAADLLHLSQPAISLRLKSLENGLGTVLIDRSKGHRTVMLTPKGEEFISVANRWLVLHQDTLKFKTTNAYPTLSVACGDSMNLYIFSKLYNQILQNHVPVNLRVKSHHYLLIYPMLAKQEIDIGLVNVQINYRNILSRPILSEPMFLVCSKPSVFKTCLVHTSNLDPSNEVYIDWGADYSRWHDYWLNPEITPFIHINSPSSVFNYMNNPNIWTIVPASMVKIFQAMGDFEIHSLQNPPPNRICYKIINRASRSGNNTRLKIFEEQLEIFLASMEWKI